VRQGEPWHGGLVVPAGRVDRMVRIHSEKPEDWMPNPLPWIVLGAATGWTTGIVNPIRAEDVSVILAPASVLLSIVLSLMSAWALRLARMPSRLPWIVFFRICAVPPSTTYTPVPSVVLLVMLAKFRILT
jgi:ABC-type glycerol-3-phosphate transport system permease component